MARVRKQADAPERLAAYEPHTITTPHLHRGRWQSCFPTEQPLAIEIGMGRGKFIYEMACQHPDMNFIGIDVVAEVMVDGLDKIARRNAWPDNLRFIWLNAESLEEVFAPGEVTRIYLNFSDPWPKNRHAKRRLTHHLFLTQYAHILVPCGEVHFKTDGRDFFAFSLNSFCDDGWRLRNITLDLHANLPAGHIATEYERRFHARGLPIYRLEAIKTAHTIHTVAPVAE